MPDLAELDEIVFGMETRGRKVSKGEFLVEVVRELDDEDAKIIASGAKALESQHDPATVVRMRHCHHQIAQLLAQGSETVEVSLITGYTPEYIYRLKSGKDFQGLLEFYGAERKRVFVDALERMKALGISTLELLEEKLESEEERAKWTKRELMEMAELMLVKPSLVKNNGGNGNPNVGVNVEVRFVSAGDASQVIDGDVREIREIQQIETNK